MHRPTKAERRRLPRAPALGPSLSAAFDDLYSSNWKFVVGNLAIGALLLIILVIGVGTWLAVLLVVTLIPPAAGLMRMATVQVRHHRVGLAELRWPMRRRRGAVVAIGMAQLVVVALLLADLVIGVAIGDLFGAALAVSAAYGLAFVWTLALVAWPLIVDPARADEPAGAQLRLAVLLVVARPLRHLLPALLLGAIVVVATLTVVPLLVFAIALVFLVAANDALAVADAWQGRGPDEDEEE